MKAVLILGGNIDKIDFDFKDCYVVGVERGIAYANAHGIQLDIAVGDFDSTPVISLPKETKIIKLNPIKDITDTHAAMELVKDYEEIVILGGIAGKRIEHFIANFKLFHQYKNLMILDNNSKIFLVPHNFKVEKSFYKYYSFFALETVEDLSLIGFKYPLVKYHLAIANPLCISNELIESKGLISYTKGKLIAIFTMDDAINT